jgi:hypothetical protein
MTVSADPAPAAPAAPAIPDLPVPTFCGLASAPASKPVPAATPAAPPAAETAPDAFSLPSFASAEPRQGKGGRWIWVALAILLTIAVGAGVQAWYQYSARPQPLSLWVADVGGQLLIEWDRTAGPIRNAKSATLDITDGREHVEIQMDADRLREGSVDYVRRADIVDVRLSIHQPRSRTVQESIRFIGQPVRRPEDADLARQRDELKAQVEKLQVELDKKDAQLRKTRAGATASKR